jgi:hypothetical protein
MVWLQAVMEMWEAFQRQFLEQWNAVVEEKRPGDLVPLPLFGGKAPAGPDALKVGNAQLDRQPLYCFD